MPGEGRRTSARAHRMPRAVIALGLAGVLTGACVSRTPADPAREGMAAPDGGVTWPALEATGNARLSPPGPGPHPILIVGHGVEERRLVNHAAMVLATITDRRETGEGVLLDLAIQRRPREPTYAVAPARTLEYRFASPSLFWAMKGKGQQLRVEQAPWSGEPVDSVNFQMLEPLGGREARGLIVCFHSLGGLTYERAVLYELQRRGWMLIVAEFPWDSGGSSVWDVEPATAEGVGEKLAAGIDARLLRAGIAARAAREYLVETTPALAGRPTLVWGASAGSFAAPAVAERLRADAMVLVGSGANILAVAQTSTFFDGGILLRPRGVSERDGPRLIERVIEAYRDHARLDPHALAPHLVRVPTLMIHAGEDEIVPAAEGETLWNRLGRPERWTLSCGHEMLFWRLGSLAQDIADWVDRLPTRSDGGPGAPRPEK